MRLQQTRYRAKSMQRMSSYRMRRSEQLMIAITPKLERTADLSNSPMRKRSAAGPHRVGRKEEIRRRGRRRNAQRSLELVHSNKMSAPNTSDQTSIRVILPAAKAMNRLLSPRSPDIHRGVKPFEFLKSSGRRKIEAVQMASCCALI